MFVVPWMNIVIEILSSCYTNALHGKWMPSGQCGKHWRWRRFMECASIAIAALALWLTTSSH